MCRSCLQIVPNFRSRSCPRASRSVAFLPTPVKIQGKTIHDPLVDFSSFKLTHRFTSYVYTLGAGGQALVDSAALHGNASETRACHGNACAIISEVTA